ncbi:ABC transporter substrate-binding protein [Clostridium sp. BJN0001]|uniref:ABC transporter substrate-binding protein n=1 Tax=Clostridium sp. BJN0001 TaxID=2930219 RepID=UPI001FCF81CA|nr:ABC transporter substrate-binding protein [Clostridium sp. BJN0001]
MKKYIKKFLSILGIALILISQVGCSNRNESNNLTTVRLNEVTRSIFYAPMYIAIHRGYFEDNGIEIDLQTGQGADKTMQAVMSKSADVGFCGPEQTIYINNQGRENYPVLFCGLTQKDGSFLVSREKTDHFDWQDIKGKDVIGGRPGGVPEMVFEYVMKKNNIDPKKDVNMVNNIDFAATAGAFKGNTGDYVTLFEPTASAIEKEGSGKIVASIGEDSGEIPYTCFFASKEYIAENEEIVQGFTNAIYEGQQWYFHHNTSQIADEIIDYFPGTDKQTIVTVLDNYRKIDSLAKNPRIEKENLDKLMDIIQDYDNSLLKERPSYDKIVDNSFADKAMNK